MEFPGLAHAPLSTEEGIALYLGRFHANEAPHKFHGLQLLAYMLWPAPGDQATRDSWMATHLARHLDQGGSDHIDPAGLLAGFGGVNAIADSALESLFQSAQKNARRWSFVGNILQTIINIHYDDRLNLNGGASISKAVDFGEDKWRVGRSQLLSFWSEFRDAAHLITAGAYLASMANKKDEKAGSAFFVALFAPEILMSVASAYQLFGLSFVSFGQKSPLFQAEGLWRVPAELVPTPAYLPIWRLLDEEIAFFASRKAKNKKYISRPRLD